MTLTSQKCTILNLRYFLLLVSEMNSEYFTKLGNCFIKNRKNLSNSIRSRRFKSFFGITPTVCCIIWNMIKDDVPHESEPKHLLWCLCFLKQYPVEHIRQSLFTADEKTIRKWTWIYVKLLSNLNVVLVHSNQFE